MHIGHISSRNGFSLNGRLDKGKRMPHKEECTLLPHCSRYLQVIIIGFKDCLKRIDIYTDPEKTIRNMHTKG